jgi:uncharacterized protein (DUF4213/DUF364 family)
MDYESLKSELAKIARSIMDEPVEVVSTRTLTPEEAIGRPDRTDYPLFKGKEVMVEASFRGARAHAFTDMPGNFQGSLRDIVNLAPRNNFEAALLVSTLNAVMRHTGRIGNTVHCRDGKPKACAEQLPGFVRERFGNPKIAFIGYQPAMIQSLSSSFTLRAIDLDRDNIGNTRFNTLIEGPEKTDEVIEWADLILATGSTCVNGTMDSFLGRKPVVFFGVTVAGLAELQGYTRYCPCSE